MGFDAAVPVGVFERVDAVSVRDGGPSTVVVTARLAALTGGTR